LPDFLQIYKIIGYRDLDQDPQQDIMEVSGLDTVTDEMAGFICSVDAGEMDITALEASANLEDLTLTPP